MFAPCAIFMGCVLTHLLYYISFDILSQVPFRTYLSTQFSVAFDVYVGTLAIIAKRVAAALGRDTPNWRLKNTCPACLYKLEGEDELSLPVLTTQDGNNSLSRHGQMERAEDEGCDGGDSSATRSRARGDDRKVPGDYYLSRSEVDEWAKEGLEEMMKGHSSDPVCALSFSFFSFTDKRLRNGMRRRMAAPSDGATCARRSRLERWVCTTRWEFFCLCVGMASC
jgi:hypothetical protein